MNAGTQAPEQLFGYEVQDSEGNKLGKVENVWVDDATEELEFISVKTGFLMGKTHIIPTSSAEIGNNSITIPYAGSKIKDAPHFDGEHELTPEEEEQVYSYYGVQRSTNPSPTGLPSGETSGAGANYDTYDRNNVGADTGMATTEGGNQSGVVLSEEQLQVGKQEVQTGNVRLRKVVHTERKEVPVELRREEVIVERTDASGATVPGDAFTEQQIDVPVMREEAVVAKEARVTGGVQLNKNVQTETQTVGDEVRKEDVVVEGDGQRTETHNRGY